MVKKQLNTKTKSTPTKGVLNKLKAKSVKLKTVESSFLLL